MGPDYSEFRQRLECLADEIADAALGRLKEGIDEGDENAVTDERRLTRARRAVEKAAYLLWDGDSDA